MPTDAKPTLDAVSLFSNCGAGDLGFARAGFRFRVMAELVQSRLDVALRNHPHAEGVCGDLTETWPKVVEEWEAVAGHRSPALLAACPPCQGMSTARNDRGNQDDAKAGSREPRNLLVLPIASVAKALNPTVVVVENVTAFLRRLVEHPDTGTGISAARLLVERLCHDYEVYPFLSDLADYGVPQTRKRAFLTFVRRNSDVVSILETAADAPYPKPTHASDHGGEQRTLAEALKELGATKLDAKNAASARDVENRLHYVPTWTDERYRMVASMPTGRASSAWDNNACPNCGPVAVAAESAECPQCSRPLLRPVVVEDGKPRLIHGFRRAAYRRMDPGRPATTITTASGRIGASSTIHPFQNRVLSPLECAHLQTIPENFDWGTTLRSRGVSELRAMIGEAVPPRFTEMHGGVIADLLGSGIETRKRVPASDPRCQVASRRLERQP